MESEWEEVVLGSLIEYQKGYAFKSKDYQEHGVKIVRVSNFTDRTIDVESCNKIAIEKYQLYNSYKLNTLDVIIATVGSWPTNPASVVGKAVQVPKELNGALLNQNAVRLRANVKTNQRFLFFLVKDKNFQNYIVSTAQGSANQASITLRDILNYKFKLPPLPEQKAIAHLLGTLDDKIELNRQMNETLEAMAQALFKSWFVDFDPVLDNAIIAGNAIPDAFAERATIRKQILSRRPLSGAEESEIKENKLTPTTPYSEHFPSEFEFTDELGWIPKGWGVRKISDICEHIRINVKPTDIQDDDLYVGLDQIEKKSLFLNNFELGLKVTSNKSSFQENDILFGKLRPYFHKVCIAPESGICSTDILVFRAKKQLLQSSLCLTLFSDDLVEYANLRATGTRMPRANAKDILNYNIPAFPDELASIFNDLVSAKFDKGLQVIESNKKLSKLRDTLLPQLLSGKLRIADAEKMVAELDETSVP